MISTARRIEYALGYLKLGLLDQASDELEAVDFADRFTPEVMAARLDLHIAAKHWDIVANYARRLIDLDQDDVGAWIALGCAVRRTESVAAARDLLLKIEPIYGGTHAVIHFNLACYHCILGDIEAAKESLAKACRMNPRFKAAALDDPDLEGMWAQIAEL